IDVLVVDDSSPDGTGKLVAEIAATEARVRLMKRPAKSGLASAYLDGFHTAIAEGYDIAIEMDSDLSHDPTELPGLLAAAERFDLVVGSRYIPGGSVTDWSRSRVALSRGGDGYGFQIELVSRAHRLGYAVGEAPITFRERVYGESKISRAIVAEALWKVTQWGWDLRFRTKRPA